MKPASGFQLRLGMIVSLVCWFGVFAVFPPLFNWAAINHYGVWFLDSFAILASNDAVARGLDPYAPNPLDYFNRPHVYSHWWLHLHVLGLNRSHNFWVGLVLVQGFFTAALARLRPRSWGELGWYLVIVGSAPVLLAVNRANNDLLIFVLLAPVVPCLLAARPLAQWLAVMLIVLSAGLKFFPAAAGLVLLANNGVGVREIRVRLVVALVALGCVGVNLATDLAGLFKLAPTAHGILTFGAINLPLTLGVPAQLASGVVLVIAAAVVTGCWVSRWADGWEIDLPDRGTWWSFVLGAILLTGCFFTGTNYGYRWVFGIWVAPFLWRLPRDLAAPAVVRRLARITSILFIFALWADEVLSVILRLMSSRMKSETALQIANRFFAIEQPVTWALFICLLAFLTHFTRESLRGLLGQSSGKVACVSAN
jgi:hypothetical protein